MDASQPPPEPQPTLAVEEAQPAQALPTKTEEQHSASSSPSASKTALPSLALFKKHLRCDANGVVDGTRAIGKECFLEWEASRAASDGDDNPHKSAKAFQRNLTAHLTGSDGRSPFLPDEEASILLALRAKRVWYASLTCGAAPRNHGKCLLRAFAGRRLQTSRAAPLARAGSAALAM